MIDEIAHLLPFVLNPHNIARFEDGAVHIGDRSCYPLEKAFVRCDSVEAVAQAIENMVTQGAGPWQAAACGLALAGREADALPVADALPHLALARQRLVATRPTNTAMARRLDLAMEAAHAAHANRESLETAIVNWLATLREQIYTDYVARARFGAQLINDGDGILTMCFAEAAFVLAMAFAHESGKRIHVYVPETRPFLQGAKLTAPSLHELGIPVTLITDSMAAAVMAQGKIDKYFTAADLITLDGHVVNKVGTFANAVLANYHRIPFFAFAWGFDPQRPDRASIEIEERHSAEITHFKNQPTTDPTINAYYPAFDITPPHLVAGVITKQGVYSPYNLQGLV
ncbi:MAG: s-methyl-5-thioribose-1-phosphate isomerase [Candidatus Promineifilaceae bacterium]